MVKTNIDKRLMVRCAQMYYDQGLAQVKIAEKLGISKSTVSRLLSRAKKSGVIQFIVNNPFNHDFLELEKKLEDIFDISEVYIVENQISNEQLKENLAYAAAKYLERIIKVNYKIGVTWGTTVSKVPKYIEINRDYKITVVPLTGGLGSVIAEIHPNQIANRLAKKLLTEPMLLHAPGMMDSVAQKKTLMEDNSITQILNEYDSLDIILSGIGSPTLNTSTMLASNYYSLEEMNKLVQKGATADVANMILDASGKGDKFVSNKRVLGISLEQIDKVPYSIGVAGGLPKLNAIYAALIGKHFNVIIIDNVTAKALLDKAIT